MIICFHVNYQLVTILPVSFSDLGFVGFVKLRL